MKKISEAIALEISKVLDNADFKSVIEMTQKAADTDAGTFEVVISDETVDRYGEVIKVDGWDTNNYMLNPIVLWGHDHRSMPIGICTSLEVTADRKLLARGRFAPAEANPFAQQVRALYDLGIVRATSVGFISKEAEGNVITKAELLEFSFVSVPANPMALSTLVKSSISINELMTKGILTVEAKSDEEEETEEVTEDPTDETPTEEATEDVATEEEVIADEEVTTDEEETTDEPETEIEAEAKNLILEAKTAIAALEVLFSKGQEPERSKAELGDEPADQKAYRQFQEGRKYMRMASTVLSEALAEAKKVRI